MSAVQHEDWHTSGASCCSPIGTCCFSWWCPCFLYGRVRHRTQNNGNMANYSSFNGSCAAFFGLSCIGIHFVLPMISRGDVRSKYQLNGNGCKDCLCAACCLPCDLIQQEKEVIYQEEKKLQSLGQPGKVDQMNYEAQHPL